MSAKASWITPRAWLAAAAASVVVGGLVLTAQSAADAQAPNAFKTGQYALGNVLYNPVPNVMVGGELQWGRRQNNSDGFHSDGLKVQFSFKYNFSVKLGG